jgi:GxxExxY protein
MNNNKLIYPELSYEIVGVLYEVHDELGSRVSEKILQRAVAKVFDKRGIKYQKEYKVLLKFQGEKIGNYYLDFLVEDKIVLELKRGHRFSKQDFKQIEQYLDSVDKKLGIMAIFTSTKLKYTRILNLY